MTRITAMNLLALAVALVVAVLGASLDASERAAAATAMRADRPAASVVDESGVAVPVGRYRRVVGLNHVADHLLVTLLERERILASSGLAEPGAAEPQRFAGIPIAPSLDDLERLIELSPDLVIVNRFASPSAVAQLRAVGIQVFDIGEMFGLRSLLADARALATLLDVPERGERFAARFERRMRAVAADVPAAERPRGIYLATYGGQIFGGSRGTSYHDVLVYGGLVDAAAERYEGWPALTSEQVLELDPEVLVVSSGKADEICRLPGLDRLRPCRGEGRVVEVPRAVLMDPGPPMLEAAEAVRQVVHGPPPSPPELSEEVAP